MNYSINITWDEESFVWIATSEDIPGLVLESGSADALIERVKAAAPELLEMNNKGKDGVLDFYISRRDRIPA